MPTDFKRLDHLAKVKGRVEGGDLLLQIVGQPLTGDVRNAGNVVDRLLWIEFRALAARARQDVHEMRLDIQEAQLEDRKEAGGPGADDEHVGLYRFAHSFPNPEKS